MHETAARDLVLVRAIETTDRAHTLWSDSDRAWATRAAAEVVTSSGREEDFLVRRAELAREQLAGRHPLLRRTLHAFTWPGWLAPAVLIAAFAVGASIDRVGDDGRIDILAPPVLGLLAWNVVVYLVVLARALARLRGRNSPAGPLRECLARIASTTMPYKRAAANAPLAASVAAFGAAWSALARPLYAARAARILHLGAAVLAAGVLVGLYVRGLAFEYRASWQSTFLDAAQVHHLLRIVLAPGSWLTGLPVPSMEHIASLRSSAPGGGENAARWVHLHAATVAVVVIVPRLVLATLAWGFERRRQRNMSVALADPYYRRLVRSFREGPLQVLVVPYSFNITEAAAEALRVLTQRAFGRSEVTVADAVAYGDEERLRADLVPPSAHLVIALFNATATPEAEAHGVFLARLASAAGARADCIAVVDETAFRQRWPNDDARLAQRRTPWQELLATSRLPGVFVNLAKLDLERDAQALEAAMEDRGA